jgi:hypothetical protein
MNTTQFLTVCAFAVAGTLSAQEVVSQGFFKAPKGVELIAADLHIHTVFSDGNVWPTIRVDEARREDLDLISLTEHLEYQPHKRDIPNPDRNRAFELALRHRKEGEQLMVVNGSEITRSMAPGHVNAVFIEDANKLMVEDAREALVEANRQGAYVFWNHPHWEAQRQDGIARLEPWHDEVIKAGLLHGIEVVNDLTFSEEALQIALDRNLTIMGTSDIHGIADWQYHIPEGNHRPMTFVLAAERNPDAIKAALKSGRTVVWFNDLIVGRAEHVESVLSANVRVEPLTYEVSPRIARVVIHNDGAQDLNLRYTGPFSFHAHTELFTVPAHGSIELDVKTLEALDRLDFPVQVENSRVAPKTPATLLLHISK